MQDYTNFDMIKIGLASSEMIRNGPEARLRNLKQLTTEH